MHRSASTSTTNHLGWVSDRTISKTPKPPPAAADEGYWLGCFFGNHLRHGPVMLERPAFSSWRCKAISDELLLRFGIYVQPINYPTVPRGTERLRLTPTPLHSDKQIDRLVTALTEIWSNSPVGSRRAGRSPASHEREMDRRR